VTSGKIPSARKGEWRKQKRGEGMKDAKNRTGKNMGKRK
jgi:hypothetical protein